MSKTIPVKLTVDDIDRVNAQLELLSDSMKLASEVIVTKLVRAGKEFAQNEYDKFPYRNSKEECSINGDSDGLSGYISLVGTSAFYEEFGTGERGRAIYHPAKNKFDAPLNDYNSGPYVSSHVNKKTGEHYWFYKPMRGENGYEQSGYTKGIPSGKMMYNTGKYLHKKSKEVCKEVAQQLVDGLK